MNRPNQQLVRPASVITCVMALSAACSSRTGEPSEPTGDRAAPDAARSDADASPGETVRLDAGQPPTSNATTSVTSSGDETTRVVSDGDADAPHSDASYSPTTHLDAAQNDATGSTSTSDGGGTACRIELNETLAEHACFHTSYGPFAAVAAAAATAVAEIAETHTAYTVTLPDATSAGVIGLRVPRTGLYAMFSDVALPLVVNDGPSVLAPIHAQPVRGCDQLTEVVVHALDFERQYSLWVGPGGTQVQVVFEQTYPDALTEVCSGQPDVSRDSDSTSGGQTQFTENTTATDTLATESTTEVGHFTTEIAAEATTVASSQDAAVCAVLKAACLTGDECCSGRCYARQCAALECRSDGYCESDDQCCSYCHFGDSPHCH